MQREIIHPSEANNHSAGWKDTVFYIAWPYVTLCSMTLHYFIHNSPPIYTVGSQIILIHFIFTPSFSETSFVVTPFSAIS